MNARSTTPPMAVIVVVLLLGLPFLSGCAVNYRVPGRGADMSVFAPQAQTDPGVARAWDRRPAAHFPAKLGVVRVQGPGYTSYSSYSYGSGAYTVVTTRDVETDDAAERLAALPYVYDVAVLNRLVIPRDLRSDLDLRKAAGAVQADLLLVYTFDTTFHVEGAFEPLAVVTLGLFPNKSAKVTSTACAALLDTRTGYVYYLGEATEKTSQLANAWTSKEAVDQSRVRAERRAFERLLDEFESGWDRVVDRFAGAGRSPHRPIAPGGWHVDPWGPRYHTER